MSPSQIGRKEISMFEKTWRFLTITLTALLMGMSFAHTLELPAKMQYDGQLYAKLQKTLYVAWGPPSVGGILEPGAIFATAVLAYLVRKRRPAFPLTLGAVLCLLLAFPVVFFLFVEPANVEFRRAALAALPPDWTRWREQWEYGHAIRFGLHLAALSALLLSVLLETPGERPGDRVPAAAEPDRAAVRADDAARVPPHPAPR
jgi:Domain of unknown function (DUF1772)